jgi:hypothetical protein
MTPLTPHSYSLKQLQNTTQTSTDDVDGEVLANSRLSNLKRGNGVFSTENISPPVLVPFNKFEYYTKLNKTDESSIENSGGLVQHQPASAKSTSTSYLMSKISSLASLTMPKNHRLSNVNNTSASTLKSAQSSPLTGQTSPVTGNANLITKIFNRKMAGTSESPPPGSVMTTATTTTMVSSPLTANQVSGDGLKSKTSVKAVKKSSTSKLSGATTAGAAVSYSNLTAARRPFNKKRSQSIHNSNSDANNRNWFYNKVNFRI